MGPSDERREMVDEVEVVEVVDEVENGGLLTSPRKKLINRKVKFIIFTVVSDVADAVERRWPCDFSFWGWIISRKDHLR